MWVAPPEPAEPNHLQQIRHPLPVPLAPGETEGDILLDGQVWEKASVLRNVADTPPIGRYVALRVVDDLAAEADGPRSGRSKPAITRSRVVFPLPDGPRMDVNDLPTIARSRPRSTG